MRWTVLFMCLMAASVLAQPQSAPASSQPAPKSAASAAPSADSSRQDSSGSSADEPDAQESSSHQTRTDIAPPPDDAKTHPDSKSVVEGLVPSPPSSPSVQEFHPWNPMKASKDIEVGNFYFKRGNYKAALDRYKEALYYKENDAVATFRLALCQEKIGDKDEARKNFEQYLKILPEGPYAKDARASLEKLGKKQPANN
ncbi:MAG TPA: tetratricopeptide repeat protein [Terriglobales bacterium]|nr:tetratricopeptide repeat protein [Terriglobales bacterium]